MRSVIVQPPVADFYFTAHRAAALGAHSVAAHLRRRGDDVSVMNLALRGRHPHPLPLPPELAHLHPFLLPDEYGPTSFFTTFKRFGPNPEQAATAILQQQPHQVLLSCFAFCYAAEAMDLAAAIRTQRPGIRIGIGGAGPSVWPEYFSAAGTMEGPAAARHHGPAVGRSAAVGGAAACSDPLRNETGRRLFDYVHTGEIDEFAGEPEPVWAVCRETRRSVSVSLLLTRGCPERCGFCSVRLTQGDRFRVPSWSAIQEALDNIAGIAEGKELLLNIEDDNLLCRYGLLEAIGEHMVRSGQRYAISAENGLDYRRLNPQKMDRLVELGLRKLNLSLAICGDELGRQFARNTNKDRLRQILVAARKLGIECVTYFICGLPGQTIHDVADALRWLRNAPTRIGISLFYPIRGLPGAPPDSDLWELHPRVTAGSAAYQWGELATADLITAFRLSRYINLEKETAQAAGDRDLCVSIRRTGRLMTRTRSSPHPVRPFGVNEALESAVLG